MSDDFTDDAMPLQPRRRYTAPTSQSQLFHELCRSFMIGECDAIAGRPPRRHEGQLLPSRILTRRALSEYWRFREIILFLVAGAMWRCRRHDLMTR